MEEGDFEFDFFSDESDDESTPKKKEASPLDMLAESTLAEYRKAFDLFDEDGGGTLDCDEIYNVLKTLGQKLPKKQIQDMVKEVDEDGNGELDFEEFVLLMVKKESVKSNETVLERLEKIFVKFDKDRDGVINLKEMQSIMKNYCKIILSEEEVYNMINSADSNNDGILQKYEFVRMILRGNKTV